jgi:hypothetical protein
MKSILTILTASFILLISSFTFSSCKDCGKKGKEPAGRGGKTSTEGDNKTVLGDSSNIPDGSALSVSTGRGGKTSTEGDNKTVPGDSSNIPDSQTAQDPAAPNSPALTLSGGGSETTDNSNGPDNSGELKDLGGSLGLTPGGSETTDNSNGPDNSGENQDLGGSSRLSIATELLRFAYGAGHEVKKQAGIVKAQIKKVIDASESGEWSQQMECDPADKANDVAQGIVDNEIWNKQNLSPRAAACLENREKGDMYPVGIFIMPVVNAVETKIARQIAEMLAEAVAWAYIAELRFEVVKAANGNYQEQDAAAAAMEEERRAIERLTEKLVEVKEKKVKAKADAERAAQAGEGGLMAEANYKIIVLAHKVKIKLWKAEIDAANARIAKLIKEYKLDPEDLKR